MAASGEHSTWPNGCFRRTQHMAEWLLQANTAHDRMAALPNFFAELETQ